VNAVLAGLAVLLLASCQTLAWRSDTDPPGPAVTERVVYLETPVPDNPLLTSRTSLTVGPYTLTPFERKALRELFGPPVVRWVEHHIRVGGEKDFTGDEADDLAYYQPDQHSIVLRKRDNEQDGQRFANLVHEVAHYWEHTQYKHFVSVRVTKGNAREVYWIPPKWQGLNIEQEAEMLSVYAALTYLLTRPDQSWRQWDTWYTRADLPRIEAYLEKEMYF